jgi:hypothetical protein
MKPGMLLLCGLALAGCKKKDEGKPAAGSAMAAGSGSAGGSAAASAVPGVLAFDIATPDPDSPDAVPVAFDGKVPRLPAISADGTLFADYDSSVMGEPVPPIPMEVVLRKVNDDTVVEHLTILDDGESAASNEKGGSNWLTPDLTKKLKERGAAVLKRLAGFRSLEAVHLEQTDEGEVKPTKIGDLVLASDDPGNGIGVELRDGHERVLHRAQVDHYSTGDDMTGCGYTPQVSEVYRDAPANMIYVEIGFHFRDDCDHPPTYVYGWSADPARADPEATAHGVIAQQLAAAVNEVPALTNNQLATTTSLAAFAAKAKPVKASDVALTVARDGKSAWGSARGTAKQEVWRASDLLVQTPQGWQLAAVAWTEPKDNAAVNRDAKAGKLVAGKLAGDPGDQGLRDAFARLTTDGLPSVRKDLVAIGSGPDERTVDGPAFAKAWNAVWKGKTTIVSSVAHATPSGTTGWVAATVELQKTGYKIPFTVFAVFEKDAAGAWSLATIQFAV